jgi:hypothetical protein
MSKLNAALNSRLPEAYRSHKNAPETQVFRGVFVKRLLAGITSKKRGGGIALENAVFQGVRGVL